MSKEKETGKEKGRIRQLARYYIPYKGLFFTDMFFAMLGAAITLVIPLIVRYITSTVVEKPLEQATGEIIRLGILMIAMVLVEMYCNFYIAYYGHVMGARIEHDMRNEIFGHYQKLSFAFFDNQKVGHLLSRITSDLFDISELLHHGPENIVISFIKLIGAMIILFVVNPMLACAACGYCGDAAVCVSDEQPHEECIQGKPPQNCGYQQSDRGQPFGDPCCQIVWK